MIFTKTGTRIVFIFMLVGLMLACSGVQQSISMDKTEVKILKKKAEVGDAKALFKLADMYYLGDSVPMNHIKASALYKKAAEHGSAEAQHLLGQMYGTGKGVDQDYVQAYVWYQIAANNGSKLAKASISGIKQILTDEQVVEGQKRISKCQARNYKDC